MPPLAWRNLLYDKIRLVATLTGVTFAVVLIVVELGLFCGFRETTSCLIDNSHADIWVSTPNVAYLELGAAFNDRKIYQMKTVPGVADVQKYIVRTTLWKRLDGGFQTIEIVGFNPTANMGGPWSLEQGRVQDLQISDGVIVDEVYKEKLGVKHIGEVFEINGHRARVVGFTRGIRSFATLPYVFTSLQHAYDFAPVPEDQTIFALVKIEPGADVEAVRRAISSRVTNVNVLTNLEFSRKTRKYWTFATGAGLAVLLAAVLGLVVGFVVVSQTIYSTTMDHLKEFGTLKAMGAPNSYVYKVILTQAGIAAVIGYALGMVISSFVVYFGRGAGAPILWNWWMATGIFFVTLFMCGGAALVSINKVAWLDPATVFKG